MARHDIAPDAVVNAHKFPVLAIKKNSKVSEANLRPKPFRKSYLYLLSNQIRPKSSLIGANKG